MQEAADPPLCEDSPVRRKASRVARVLWSSDRFPPNDPLGLNCDLSHSTERVKHAHGPAEG